MTGTTVTGGIETACLQPAASVNAQQRKPGYSPQLRLTAGQSKLGIVARFTRVYEVYELTFVMVA